MRKFAAAVGMVILSVFMIASITAGAAEKKVKSEVVMKVGNKVHLFHSGTPDVKKIFLNDVVTVYREIVVPRIPSQSKWGRSRCFRTWMITTSRPKWSRAR